MSGQFGEGTVKSIIGAGGSAAAAAGTTKADPRFAKRRIGALDRVTPSLVERGLKGVDPQERKRLKTRAFEDIGAKTKSAIGGLRETFGRSGIRGGAQGADLTDIIEAAIGATGAASTGIEGILKGDARERMQTLVELLSAPLPTVSENLEAKKFSQFTQAFPKKLTAALGIG